MHACVHACVRTSHECRRECIAQPRAAKVFIPQKRIAGSLVDGLRDKVETFLNLGFGIPIPEHPVVITVVHVVGKWGVVEGVSQYALKG